MEPGGGRAYFLANACQVCKSKTTTHACEICRMVFYCSPEHRRENWFDHSDLCWAIRKITEGSTRQSLWELFDGNDFAAFRHQIATKCTELLRRKLHPWEFELIYYPRVCSVCREFNWHNLTRCKGCEFVFTCGKNHFRKDHSRWCKTLRIYSDLVTGLSLGLDMKPIEVEIRKKNVNSMAEVLKSNKSPELQIALTSEILTYPLTLFHGLRSINALQQRELVVLLIGAEIQAEVEPLYKWEKYLLHCLDNVDSLTLKFLGPELQENSNEFSENLCETCRKRRKNMKFQFISGKFYHEYSTNGTEQPQLICAFNSGMYRNFGFGMINSWESTIKKLFARGNPPVMITEYTCEELKLVLERIQGLCGDVNVVVQPEANPFASWKPGLNIISEDEIPVIFKNYYYTILASK